jgi:ABC-type nickel/cobalt efflux system permease component RcnA
MEERLAELGLMAALGLGVILGLRHALDPDHVVAVSTIVSEYRNPLRSFWVGISWGIGHTTTLFLIGIVIIALRLTIPDRLALLLEFAVGVMLVGLGVQVIYNFRKKKVHQHEHGHVESSHQHFHSHAQEPAPAKEHHQSRGVGKPFFRKKSYFIGMVHGVAGSAALTLLVLASIESPLAGMVYLLLFGLGSVLSMGIVTIFISLPFVFSSNRLPNLNRFIQFGVGALSIVFGFGLMYEIGFVEGLF